MTKEAYAKLVQEVSPPTKHMKTVSSAFLIGGAICALGQALTDAYLALGAGEKSGAAASCTIIVVTALLTGAGVFDRLAKHAGAGTLVPITGFANAVASPAIEFRTEGLILGTGAKMFLIAGPVIVWGLAASAVYGVLLVLLGA